MMKTIGLILSFVAGMAFAGLAFVAFLGPRPYELPHDIIDQIASPRGSQTAMVLEAAHHLTWFDLLGGDRRFYLALRRGCVTCILNRELSDGYGTYEGGFGTIRWEDENTVFLERWVNDREANLAFNTADWEWIDRPKAVIAGRDE
jgi:hypothetical protein